MGSPYLKVGGPVLERFPLHPHIGHISRSWSDFDFTDELFHCGARAFRFNLDVPVAQVPHVPPEPQRLRSSGDKPAEADALDHPFHHDVRPDLHAHLREKENCGMIRGSP